MININKIVLDFDTRRLVLESPNNPPPPPEEPEMSEFESAFLCGLLRHFRPKKIVEVGVAAGVTTAIILQCLENIGQNYEIYSIDALVQFYRDPTKKSGFFAEHIKKNLQNGTHETVIGKTLPFIIDDIGGDIDFVILDTMHTLPGENLDFLAILPYLKPNAVVCMHDVSLNQRDVQTPYFQATTSLFASVVADKYLNFEMDDQLMLRYPNIAAFQINSDTMSHIENIFLNLILRWKYLPSLEDLKGFAGMLTRHYSQGLFLIFQ